ncbi:hypothetical protein [Paenibacillus sp. J2TS4]|uniref:hypothetical protein n=1 Tax=Paenibacillus sp. J2TS4 TaxID=2807194 RepID=UPI001B2E1BAD|nr:hypothetical protein [Paenibacillus sp. J2TS4]GIP31918.1 hypothetical protein J2TS4_11280 [Paenibacillus sp. J2TS4]
MDLNVLAKQVEAGKFEQLLVKQFPEETALRLGKMTAAELEKELKQVIRVPIQLSGEMGPELFELFYTASWFNLFERLAVPANAMLFEIAAGDTVYIPKALDAYTGKGAQYATANLNKELSRNFRAKTAGLRIDIRVIEDDGAHILNYYGGESFDVIALHHALNDIIQTIIASKEGIDTVNSNWWTIEPQLLQAVMDYYNRGELKNAAYESFIRIISTLGRLLKQGGYMIFDNCTHAGYEKLGYSTEFHSSYIQLAREWIQEADVGLEEVKLEQYNSKWWMILQKR